MCGGVYFTDQGEDTRFYFANPKATLPVITKTHTIQRVPWGRREQQAGVLPLGGCAHLDAIYAGRWDRWMPTPVKLAVKCFMELDIEGHARWYDLTKGQYLQGLIAHDGHERRVYVVTLTPQRSDAIHERWPRII